MMRTLLALAAGLICGVLGMRHAGRLRQESHRLHRWETLLQHLCLLLQEGGLTLPEVFRRCAREDSPADLLLRRLADDLQANPLSSLGDLFHGQGTEEPALSRLMDRLDRGSLESRVQAVQQAHDEIALLAAQARDKAAQDARMWCTLGWTCGACLTLLLL